MGFSGEGRVWYVLTPVVEIFEGIDRLEQFLIRVWVDSLVRVQCLGCGASTLPDNGDRRDNSSFDPKREYAASYIGACCPFYHVQGRGDERFTYYGLSEPTNNLAERE